MALTDSFKSWKCPETVFLTYLCCQFGPGSSRHQGLHGDRRVQDRGESDSQEIQCLPYVGFFILITKLWKGKHLWFSYLHSLPDFWLVVTMILIHSYSLFISHHFIQAYGEYKTPGPLKNPVGKRCPYMCLWFYTIVSNRKN